ncbi:MAG: L,D-transpeptidase family protein [Bdellovibrionales bacterium]
MAYALPSASDIQGALSSNSPIIEGFSLDKPDLASFYKARDHKAVWNFVGASNTAALATFLNSAEELVVWHGLRREDYPFDIMRKMAIAQDDASLLKLEILVMDTLLRLARDLHGDMVDLDDYYPGWSFHRQPLDIPAKLADAASAQGLSAFLETMVPTQPAYQALAQSLAAYRKMAEHGGWRPIAPGPTLKLGERSPRVTQLRARLEAEESLTFPVDTALAQPKSTSAKRDGIPSPESSKFKAQRVGQTQTDGRALFASTVPSENRLSQPALQLPNANRSIFMLQLSHVFERFAPLELAPGDIKASPEQDSIPHPPFAALPRASFAEQALPAQAGGVSFGGLSLDPEYPGQPAVPYLSTPLKGLLGQDAPAQGEAAPAQETSGESLQPEVPSDAQEQPQPAAVAPEAAAQPPAQSSAQAQDSTYFDDDLHEKLKLWQVRNGLDGDGSLGPNTLEMLNAPVSDRIGQIRANMERWRHMPENYPLERYALVNIADASLLLVEDGKIAYHGPVVVGRVDRKTPFIHSKIRSMIVNPFWHVPAKIARKDILPKLRRDPHYLEKLGFVISGHSDDPHGANIDWESMQEREFNFRLRQSPGDANSLGRIKFDFDNTFAVYMHGTPHQELFGKDRRNFSSGCIRLRDPLEVAETIMASNPENWDTQKLADAIESGKTRWVAVAKPLPLFILYETVFVDLSGKLQFRKDVYNYDRFLIKTLETRAM